MQEINLIDKSFNRENTARCSLMLQVDKSGLAYCVYDQISSRFIVFKRTSFENVVLDSDLTNQLAGAIKCDELLDLPYQTVHFLGYTQQATLVPDVYFDRSAVTKILTFTQADEISDEIFSNYIEPYFLHVVFALPDAIVSLVRIHFKNINFACQLSPFLFSMARTGDISGKTFVSVGLHDSFFDIACVEEGKLVLCNSFAYVNENDILYYVLYIYSHLGLNVQTVPLYLSGEQSSRVSYFDQLKQYLPLASYNHSTGLPGLAAGLSQVRKYKFHNLLNLQMCASSAVNSVEEG